MSSVSLFLLTVIVQGALILVDEFYFHHERGLPKWERIGHPLDTFSVILPFLYMSFLPYPGFAPVWLVGLMGFSCVLISKDEGVHAKESRPGEHWLHAFLFMIHPILFFTGYSLWKENHGPHPAIQTQLAALSLFLLYQVMYWNLFAKKKQSVAERTGTAKTRINNELYHDLGERWYDAKDDPVALLRAEAKTKNPWVERAILNHFSNKSASYLSVLDVACGAGFLANDLARRGFNVEGVDLSESSLKVACAHDHTHSVKYQTANAYALPFPDASFDAITCMDFLEHVDDPAKVITEASRVLKPGGIFLFHTFNRNLLAHFIIIKGMEWFVKNTPKNLHVIELFVKPNELKRYCFDAGMKVNKMKGIAPKFGWAFFSMLRTGVVPDDFGFRITNNTLLSYVGFATKK